MADLICTIDCIWNSRGEVIANITTGSIGDALSDNLRLLSPSIPMVVSHQLGTFLPNTGLVLTSQFINYVITQKEKILPINRALRGIRLDFMRRRQGGVAIQFKPEAILGARTEDLEEGSRQFVYNYAVSIFENLPYYNLIICKIFLGLSLQSYLDFLQKQIDLGKISSSVLAWNSDIAVHMTKASLEISTAYKTGTPDGYNEESETNTIEFYEELSEKYKEICKTLEL